jgi:hypothetical protein
MLKTVGQHDLPAWCRACNTTVRELSLETGLPEEALLRFAAGELALSGEDRMRIVETLNGHATEDSPLPENLQHHPIIPSSLSVGPDDVIREIGRSVMTEIAYERLQREIQQEQEADAKIVTH